jgi:hypothetical protein
VDVAGCASRRYLPPPLLDGDDVDGGRRGLVGKEPEPNVLGDLGGDPIWPVVTTTTTMAMITPPTTNGPS